MPERLVRFWAGAAWVLVASGLCAEPKVLLYHSFARGLTDIDFAASPVKVSVGRDVKTRRDGVSGPAAEFEDAATDSVMRIGLGTLGKAEAGTLALWQILDSHEPLTVSEQNLLTVLDQDGRPIFQLNKSGHVYVYDDGKRVHLECFDALWWLKFDRNHLAVTWDARGAGTAKPSGLLVAYWDARPYAALALDLGSRRPSTLVIGDAAAGFGVDELYLLDEALPLRGIWDLMRRSPGKAAGLENSLAERCRTEAQRPTAAREAAWSKAARSGALAEAESAQGLAAGQTVSRPVGEGQKLEGRNGGNTASGRAYAAPGKDKLSLKLTLATAGEYALGLRYCLDRTIDTLWPQNTKGRTWWSENYATVSVRLDGKPVAGAGRERLYPTGTYNGHAGDLLVWGWHAVAAGRKTALAAGEHMVEVAFEKGFAAPLYDAVLLTSEPGPEPEHPRWVDSYRIPPAWWVDKHETRVDGTARKDIYTVVLRNRCEEPCSYEVRVGSGSLSRQRATADIARIALSPLEEKAFRVTFETPANEAGLCEWAAVYLWNEDAAIQQEYRLWNNVPGREAVRPRPRGLPAPDPGKQAAFRQWLRTRDPNALTPELKAWAKGSKVTAGRGLGTFKEAFPAPLLGERLAALDRWMAMSEKDFEEYLPHGPTVHQNSDTGTYRAGIELTGAWYGKLFDLRTEPEGDVDLITTVSAKGIPISSHGEPPKGPEHAKEKTWRVPKDYDIIQAVRDARFQTLVGREGGWVWWPRGQGISLVAEAFYLTGDPGYAQKAFLMCKVLARRYTSFTKHFYGLLHREDRDWWGGRVGGRYQIKYGPRYYQAMGAYALDLIWSALTQDQITLIEHNILRWGMYEGMAGPLFAQPEHFAAGNREDMPFLALGDVLDDPEPRKGLRYFYDIYRDVLHPDGLHICSLGSYGGVGAYVEFMQKLQELGVDVVKGNDALRNCFLAQPRFIFSGGGMPNIGDGGGVNLQGLGVGFGCPNAAQYAWARQFYREPLLEVVPGFLDTARKATGAPPDKRREAMLAAYAPQVDVLSRIWPSLFVAEVSGLAMLRNRMAAEPVDWVEVIFDYGRFGGRAHGHPAKLQTIPSLNGQIVSMEYGYGAFGKPEGGGFHTRSYAHNVVVADGRDQRSAAGPIQIGSLREAAGEADTQWVDADSSRIYDGIYMRRTLFTTELGIVDIYLCRSDREHTYDWMFHSFGVAKPAFEAAPVQLEQGGALSFAKGPRGAALDSAYQVTWENQPLSKPAKKAATALLDEPTYVRLWGLPQKGTRVVLFAAPILPEVVQDCEIDYLMLRRKVSATVFATVQEPWRASRGPRVKGVSRVPVRARGNDVAPTDAYAIEVTRSDGGRQVFFVNYSGEKRAIGRVETDANIAVWTLDAQGGPILPRHSRAATFVVK